MATDYCIVFQSENLYYSVHSSERIDRYSSGNLSWDYAFLYNECVGINIKKIVITELLLFLYPEGITIRNLCFYPITLVRLVFRLIDVSFGSFIFTFIFTIGQFHFFLYATSECNIYIAIKSVANKDSVKTNRMDAQWTHVDT